MLWFKYLPLHSPALPQLSTHIRSFNFKKEIILDVILPRFKPILNVWADTSLGMLRVLPPQTVVALAWRLVWQMVPSPHPWPYPFQPISPCWPSPLPLAPFRDGTGRQFSTPVSQFLILMHKVEPSTTMILHQNHHLKVAVVKEALSKPHWRMSCAQKMSHDFKATNTFCCKQLHIAPFCVEIPDLQAVTSTILCAPRRKVKRNKTILTTEV